MKVIFVSIMLTCLALPVFCQEAATQRYKSMSDSMGSTISSGNTKLRDFDSRIGYNNNGKVYGTYRARFDSLARAIRDSEIRLNRLLQSYDRVENIREERDKYESLVKQLETMKSEYDDWLRSIQ
jgi:hypothetical protein